MSDDTLTLGARPLPAPPDMSPEHYAFCLARQAMNLRFLEWLRAGAEPTDVADELVAVGKVLNDMLELERG